MFRDFFLCFLRKKLTYHIDIIFYFLLGQLLYFDNLNARNVPKFIYNQSEGGMTDLLSYPVIKMTMPKSSRKTNSFIAYLGQYLGTIGSTLSLQQPKFTCMQIFNCILALYSSVVSIYMLSVLSKRGLKTLTRLERYLLSRAGIIFKRMKGILCI